MSEHRPRWRLLNSGFQGGAANMALDLALQRCHRDAASPPTLHVYGWKPRAVSIGRMQHPEVAVDLEACLADGVDVVRRPTGGRAVLHGDDFTFSIVTAAGAVLPSTVRGSYMVLAAVVATALSELGVSADLEFGQHVRPGRQACFSSSTIADATVGGRKIVGGAQRWDGPVLLQQNSILCASGHERTLHYIRPARRQSTQDALLELTQGTVGLQDVGGCVPSRDDIIAALCAALQRELGALIEPGDASSRELEVAENCISAVRVPCA